MTTNNLASTIQQQIGSKAFYMLGAYNLIDHGNALSFRIRGSRKANYVKITLTADDLYDVEFQKIGRAPLFACAVVSETAGAYVDMLHDLIEAATGPYTSL